MPCNNPLQLKTPNGSYRTVPCNYCQGCRVDRISLWQSRINLSAQKASFQGYQNTFILISYDDDHLPARGVDKDSIQRYIKRLRKSFNGSPYVAPDWKYYLVSEYGEQTHRPHYHAIFTGVSPNLRNFREHWHNGFVYPRPLFQGGIRYVLKYLDKARPTKQQKEIFDSYGVNPPFYLSSRGFGDDFYLKHIDFIDDRGCINIGSSCYRVPRSFLEKYGINLSKRPPSRSDIDLARRFNMNYEDYMAYSRSLNEQTLVARAKNKGDIVQNSLTDCRF